MTYRMTLEDAQPIADAIANMPQGVSRGDAVIDAIEAIVAREVAATKAEAERWSVRAERERDEARAKVAAVEALADEWEFSQGDLANDTFPIRAAAQALRAALGESR